MLKASALYIVIIVSLMIAILSASFIFTAYYYRLEYQKDLRYNRLLMNLNSGFAILLSSDYNEYDSDQSLDLYGDQADSIQLRKERWGVFDLATAKAFTQTDTLKRSFLIGNTTMYDQTAIYLADENRPLSVSGDTRITGDAELPKSGVKQAYVEGRSYSGKKMIDGNIKNSSANLPVPEKDVIDFIQQNISNTNIPAFKSLPDYLFNSFFNDIMYIKLEPGVNLSGSIEGRIVLLSDTTIRITSHAVLKDILVFAPSIIVEDGFKGNCQLFATDSIVIGKNAVFSYPSCLGVVKKTDNKTQSRIVLGNNSLFYGILFNYEETKSALLPIIILGKDSRVIGEVYAGLIKMDRPVSVDGKVSCNRFIIQTPASLYENYLIDIALNREARNKHYLAPVLFSNLKTEKGVVKWMR